MEISRNRAWASGFESPLKLKIYSQALYTTPAVVFARVLLFGLRESRSCPRALSNASCGHMEPVWSPDCQKCPVCPECTTPYVDMVLFGINTTATRVSHKSWDCVSTSSWPTWGLDDWGGRCWRMKWIWHWRQVNSDFYCLEFAEGVCWCLSPNPILCCYKWKADRHEEG